jgi:hypothetical protein
LGRPIRFGEWKLIIEAEDRHQAQVIGWVILARQVFREIVLLWNFEQGDHLQKLWRIKNIVDDEFPV